MSKRVKLLTKIANHFGLKNQKEKTIEECKELIQAIENNDIENIHEEVADVIIMCLQLVYLMDIDLCSRADYKLKRTKERYKI